MKRFMIFTLMFIMLVCVITMPWADTRTRNVNKNYGSCSSSDSDGPLSANGSITVDVDYPGEGKGFVDKTKSWIEKTLFGYGIAYEATASVSGKAPNDDYEGEYGCYAWVPNDEDPLPRDEWRKKVNENVKAKDRTKLDKDHNWDGVHANNELSKCTGWGDVDGSSPEKGEWVVVEGPSQVSGSEIVYWLE